MHNSFKGTKNKVFFHYILGRNVNLITDNSFVVEL